MNKYKETVRMLSMRNALILTYTILGVALFIVTCVFFMYSNSRGLMAQSENYTSVAGQQSAKHISNFCASIERSARMIYDDKDFLEFYVKGSIPTAEERKTISDLTVMMTKTKFITDYADFGIVYSSGIYAGSVSDGIKDLFGNDFYGKADELLGDKPETWTALYSGSLSRACFLKRLNPYAILITTFYSTKLGSIISTGNEMSRLSICVTDSSGRVIHASDNLGLTAGAHLPSDMESPIDGRIDITVGNSTGAICAVAVSNGWIVYSRVLADKDARYGSLSTRDFIIFMGMTSLLLFVVSGIIISAFYTSERKKRRISETEYDEDLGVLTPFYCEDKICDRIETSLVGGTWAFTLVKIKDTDLIRSRLGEDFLRGGQKQLAGILKESFGDSSIIGINDDNALVVFTDFSDYDLFKAHDNLVRTHNDTLKLFSRLLVGDNSDYKLDVAMGVCIYPDQAKDYDELDLKARQALEAALDTENDSLVFYDEKKIGGGHR